MTYLHVVITRFSYRFSKSSLVDKLLNAERLEHRLKIFETFCWSSLLGQTNPKFYWIIIIDPLLPQKYREQIYELVRAHKASPEYPNRGPRDVWLHEWDWDKNKLERVDWILKYFDHNPKFLITTRLDDDDCLSRNFVSKIQSHLLTSDPKSKIQSFRYISYCRGYQYILAKNQLKINQRPMIALGLTLITRLDKYPMCVYLGNHTHIPRYISRPQLHERMIKLYRRNGDLPATPQQSRSRLTIIKDTDPMWVRTIHGHNLQPDLQKTAKKHLSTKVSHKIEDILKNRFNLVVNRHEETE